MKQWKRWLTLFQKDMLDAFPFKLWDNPNVEAFAHDAYTRHWPPEQAAAILIKLTNSIIDQHELFSKVGLKLSDVFPIVEEIFDHTFSNLHPKGPPHDRS